MHGITIKTLKKWSDILKWKLFLLYFTQYAKSMFKFYPSPPEIKVLLGFPCNATDCHSRLFSGQRLSVWGVRRHGHVSPTKAAAGGSCQTAGIKKVSGDRGVALQHNWALEQVVSSSSGTLGSTAFLNFFQSIFLEHPIEQSLRAFQRPYLILCPLEFYCSFVKGGGTSYLHVMLWNLQVKSVVCP